MAKLRIEQNPFEFEWFVDTLKKEGVRSYLEIGSRDGGSLFRVAEALPVPSFFVSVDVRQTAMLDACFSMVTDLGHEMALFYGDSTNERIVEGVQNLGPFDACFIDANHTLPYLEKDWANYGPMCRIVAFHDVGWKHKPGGSLVEVPQFWASIKGAYRHREINLNERKNGIGVLWR